MGEEQKKDKAQDAESSVTEQQKVQNTEQDVQQSTKEETEKTVDKNAVLEKENEDLKKQIADLKDQLLRRAADFDNFRKQKIKEIQDAYDYGNEKLLADLLDSLDNFDRTVDAAASAKDVKSITDGVKMINKTMVKLLEDKYNLSSYGAAGDKFNPDEHQAIGSVQGPVAEPVLKEVYLKGYKLKDRVIRHAKVMVTMPDGSVKPKDEKKEEKK